MESHDLDMVLMQKCAYRSTMSSYVCEAAINTVDISMSPVIA